MRSPAFSGGQNRSVILPADHERFKAHSWSVRLDYCLIFQRLSHVIHDNLFRRALKLKNYCLSAIIS